MQPTHVLVVDDDRVVRWTMKESLEHAGYQVASAGSVADAVQQCERSVHPADLVLLDYRLPDGDGLQALRRIQETVPDAPVIMMTAHGDVSSAVEAMKLGAHDFLQKPVEGILLKHTLERAMESSRARRELQRLRREKAAPHAFDRMIGDSAVMSATRRLLQQIAQSPASTVLLSGESGTGKDLAASAIHYNSSRARARFVNITCSALPESLLESELFGHERGAFTDAKQKKRGLLELAHKGTVFLDEVGEMPSVLQAKLLRFLEQKAFRRVGGDEDVGVDVRVIAATNRNLAREVEAGRFREDLFFRLNVMPVELPSLRDHPEDILPLVHHFIAHFNEEFGKRVLGLSKRAATLVERYGWPGNVRELRNLVERAMLLVGQQDRLESEHFASIEGETKTVAPAFELPATGIDIEEVERAFVTQALVRTGWNQTAAARLVGLHRDQIRYRIKKFGLSPPAGISPRHDVDTVD